MDHRDFPNRPPRQFALMLCVALASLAPASAEGIKVGILKVGSSGPVYLAQDHGDFAAEGLTAELVNFESGQAVAVAVVAGELDMGVTGLTASLYNLAAHGDMRVLAGLHREARGFRMLGYVASKRAVDAGLTSLKDIPGHSMAITTVGSTTHYAVGLLAEKYGYPIESVKIMPVQTISNSVAVVVGGQADVGMIPSTLTPRMVEESGAKVLGWVGDETPWQIGSVFVATKTADDRRDMLVRFLRALKKGAQEYHAAFIGPNEERKDGPTAPEALAVIGKYVGEKPERLELELPYVDPDLRIDLKDVRHQIAWYKAQGMIKGDVTAESLVDMRYAVPLP
ncbi:MAG TPA: ABC transporter substrate-binding protein [Stellaceae bacterium]|nr:ABC transporter substrate-binding protein [Stellaceae bacterium]